MLETIVAPATPYGESSIGVIRISGSKALEIVKLLTKAKVFKNRYAHYRKVYLDNDIIERHIHRGRPTWAVSSGRWRRSISPPKKQTEGELSG